jgi:hypothetical protein
MLKNIENAYKNKANVRKTWIVKPLIFIDMHSSQSQKQCKY